MRIRKRTLPVSVFFCAWLFFSLSSSLSLAACPPSHINETARVKNVHDGDTVKLTDGRKVRLIGINTPELARDKSPTQPYATQARDALRKLLKQHDNRIALSYGIDKKDKYGRTLAHLYLPNNNNVQELLLRAGYATAFTTPPNDRMASCYRQAESQAIDQHQGIWSLDNYQIRLPEHLGAKDRGFRRIEGIVSDLDQGKKALWIRLPLNATPGHVHIRIAKKDLYNFDLHTLKLLSGKRIRIRGWIHPSKKGYFMSLRHPSSLTVLSK